MKRWDCFKFLAEQRDGELVICNLGFCGSEWYEITHAKDAFYLRSGLGMISPMGLGLALTLPHRKVWALDGDGGLTINLGTLLTQANTKPRNMKYFVLFNGEYGASGGQLLPASDKVDFAGMAKAAGIENVYRFSDLESFKAGIVPVLKSDSFAFICLDVEKGTMAKETFPFDPVEMKYHFARHMEELENIKLMGGGIRWDSRISI